MAFDAICRPASLDETEVQLLFTELTYDKPLADAGKWRGRFKRHRRSHSTTGRLRLPLKQAALGHVLQKFSARLLLSVGTSCFDCLLTATTVKTNRYRRPAQAVSATCRSSKSVADFPRAAGSDPNPNRVRAISDIYAVLVKVA